MPVNEADGYRAIGVHVRVRSLHSSQKSNKLVWLILIMFFHFRLHSIWLIDRQRDVGEYVNEISIVRIARVAPSAVHRSSSLKIAI